MEKLKIYDKETQEYLKTLGISEEQIASIKRRELKKAVIKRLQLILELFEKEQFQEIEKYLAFSSSGDGWGCENHYISFDDIVTLNERDGTDIGTVIEEMSRLRHQF